MKQNEIEEIEEIEGEIWTTARFIKNDGTILDFTGLYEVSDHGRVRSLNYRHTGKTKVRSQSTAKDPRGVGAIHYQVPLRLNKNRYCLKVHRLVLSSFKGCEYFPGAVCDHIDARTCTRCDNRLSNLRWVTNQQNTSTARSKTLKSKALTNRTDQSKRIRVTDLSTNEVTEYPSAKEAGRVLGINPYVPSHCINKRNGYYKKMNLKFEYIE